MKKWLIAGVAGILVILALSQAFADSSSLFRNAGSVEPIKNNNVRMAEETVRIRAYAGASYARCEFVFVNESNKAQQVLMGFPASLIAEGGEGIDPASRLADFTTYENGKVKKVRLEKSGNKYEFGQIAEWYTWPVDFKPGEKKTILNTYKSQNYSAPWGRHTGYILVTGAPWKGTIGKAEVSFEFPDTIPGIFPNLLAEPKGYKIKDNTITWQFEELEPDTNIDISFENPNNEFDLTTHMLEMKPSINAQEYYDKISKVREMMWNKREEEGLKMLQGMLKDKYEFEEVYLELLQYYHQKNDISSFMAILKEEAAKLNSPSLYKLAQAYYPEQLKASGLPNNNIHPPTINEFDARITGADRFEVTSDLHDDGADMTYTWILATNNASDWNNLLDISDQQYLFGLKDYHYIAHGKLKDKYSDLILRINLEDYIKNEHKTVTKDYLLPGTKAYFHTGEALEKWIPVNRKNLTLLYYDGSVDREVVELADTLDMDIELLNSKIGLDLPVSGYVINIYKPEHFGKLIHDKPQEVTRMLKMENYNQGHENNEKFDEKYCGEVLIPSSETTTDMEAAALRRILYYTFGEGWLEVDEDIMKAYSEALLGTSGTGSIFKAYRKLSNQELQMEAVKIGKKDSNTVAAQTIEKTRIRSNLTLIIVSVFLIAVIVISGLAVRRKITKNA